MSDDFGSAVAVSGEWAIAGSSGDSKYSGVAGAGAAYLLNVNTGRVHAVLTAPDPSVNARFGASVVIELNSISTSDFSSGPMDAGYSAFTDVVLVGATGALKNGNNGVGAVYVFALDGTKHAVVARKLVASDGQFGDHFGCAMAIHGDRAVIGARGPDNVAAMTYRNNGAAYIFNYRDGTQIARLSPVDNPVARTLGCLWFGAAVAMNEHLVLVGAPHGKSLCTQLKTRAGAAFTFDATTLNQTSHLLPGDAVQGAMFGASVAMLSHSAGRSEMLVGAPGASGERGAMYRVDQTGGVTSASWRKVTGPPSGAPYQPRFGSALAVDGASGIVLIASDRAARDRTTLSGVARFLRLPVGGVPTLPNIVDDRTMWNSLDEETDDRFGSSVAVNGDGVAVIGARNHYNRKALGRTGGVFIFHPMTAYPPPAPPALPPAPPIAPSPPFAPPRPAALSETFAGFGDFLLIIFAVVAAALLMLIVGLMRKMKIVKVPKAGQPGSPEKPTRAHHGPMSIVDLDSGKEVMTPEQRRANRQHAQLQNAAITSRLNALKRSVDAQPKTAWGDDAVKSKSSPFGLRGPPAPPAERRSPMGAKAAARERLAAGNAGVLPRRG